MDLSVDTDGVDHRREAGGTGIIALVAVGLFIGESHLNRVDDYTTVVRTVHTPRTAFVLRMDSAQKMKG